MAVEDKVVSISFESGRFESGINRAIAALEKLKAALHFPTAGKGLEDINAAAKKVDMGHIAKGVEAVKSALNSLRLVAIGVLSQLATQAVRFAGRFVKALTLDPLKAGFQEYSTNLTAIQTILANTQAAGTKMKDVNAALNELNRYSDKTIYNFSQMAKNIGTFTAAGVGLKPAVASIKGIANLAALSGSNAEQASTAMYQLSQAISAGSVKLQDWNSVVNAGMGGTVFQRALAQTAVAMGKLPESAVKLVGPMKNVSIHGEAFRQSLSTPGKASWLTSKVLTNTLQQFTGDLTDAQLAAQGFNKAQIKAIQQTAKTAMHAATEVKTIAQVWDVAKETMGSGWAQTFAILFGNFEEAKKTFTNLSNAINGFINANARARNKVLADWKALGGRTVLINSIKTAFQNLGAILKPIKAAFRDVFPAITGKNLYDLTLKIQDFARALKPSAETVDGLKRTFRGLFALLDIGKQVIVGIMTGFGHLFSAVGKGSGGFLKFTGSIGDFIYALDQALKHSKGIQNFFATLGDILAVPIRLIGVLADALGNLFSGFSSGGISGQMEGMVKSMSPLERIITGLTNAWNNFIDSVKQSTVLQSVFQGIIQFVQAIGPAIGQAAANMNFEAILAVIRTGLLGGLVLMLKQFFGKGSLLDQVSKGFAGGIIANISGAFKALEGSMVSMQNNIKAKTLKEIAIAIALLAGSVVALSLVKPEALNRAIAGIGLLMGELLGAMKIFDTITKTGGFLKLPIVAAGLVIFAGAVDLLAIAVIALSRLSWGELAKGLGGIAFLLAAIVAASIPLGVASKGLIRAGIGITAIAIGLNILAVAVKQLGSMSLGALAKGLGSVAVGLGIISAAMTAMPKGMGMQAAALIGIAFALKTLSGVVEKFSGISWAGIGKGMAGIAGALVIIAGAMMIMPPNMTMQAAALILVSVAIGKIASAVAAMGGMSIGGIAKGLITLAASLGILALALYAFQGTIAGAAALTIAAAGISMLAGALVAMGGMSWTGVAKSLILLAAAFTIIGVAGALITPVIPTLLGFGAALLLIGGGLALAGAGIFLIATGLSALVVAIPTALGVIVAALNTLKKGIIDNAKLLITGLLDIANQLAVVAPKFVDAIVKILGTLLDAIIKLSPKIAEAFNALIDMAIQVLGQNQGKIIQAGFDLLLALLNGIKNNIGAVASAVANIIIKLLSALAGNYVRIYTAGVQILVKLVTGILSAIAKVPTAAVQIVAKFVSTIASNLGRIVTAGLQLVIKFVGAIANSIGKVITVATKLIVGFVTGIGNAGPKVIAAAVNTIIKLINALQSNSVKLANAGMVAIVHFLNGIAAAINAHSGEMRAAGMNVGVAIIDGMTGGLLSRAGDLYSKISSVVGKAMSLMHKIPGVKSPSTVTTNIGKEIINGLIVGMDGNAPKAYDSAEAMSQGVIDTVNDIFQTTSPSKVMKQIGRYVVKGFADGLVGFPDEVKKTFDDLNKRLTDAMANSRKTIDEESKKLAELRKKGQTDTKEFRNIQSVIKENQLILERSTAAHKALVGTLRKQRVELTGLAREYEKVHQKLQDAQQALVDIKKARDDQIKSFADQYATLPEIVKEDAEGKAVDQLQTYMNSLTLQADAVAKYHETLDQLRKLGLDDATYQKLVEEGTADQAFATQLLSGGKTAVESLNTLDANLKKVSDTLAKNAGTNLYKAGVQAAEGLVKGLQSQEAKLIKQMEKMADRIVAALKKRLKIKSPSEIFAEMGKYAMEGLAKGFDNSAKMVTNAVDDAAQSAIDTMKSSMSKISDVVTNELNPNPVITPILDLTQVRSQAAKMSALTATTPITATVSYGQAAAISSEQLTAQTDQEAAALVGPSVKFEQNNYSPESLTEIEIYRQTKNQLSQLKSALALT